MDPYTTYAQQAASTASPAQLVLMLYDGALTRLEQATQALEAEPASREAAHTALTKAQAIVHELAVTLDHDRGGALAANLADLYGFCMQRMLDANVAKDPGPIGEVVPVLRGLRDAWAQGCVHAAVPASA
jgi:flagellar secretion chaperone FliS